MREPREGDHRKYEFGNDGDAEAGGRKTRNCRNILCLQDRAKSNLCVFQRSSDWSFNAAFTSKCNERLA
ncbi:hypothetical protein GCM10027402_06700 [Arthrobacter monumenti]